MIGAIASHYAEAAVPSGYAAEVLADNPLGYWRMGAADIGPVVVAATASSNFASEPPTNAIDGNSTTHWTTNGTPTGWLRLQLDSPATFVSYQITRRDDIPNRNPKDWTFEGSNDGTTWTVLDTRTAITWPTAGETKTFTFANTVAYLYCRLNVTANGGDTYLSVTGILVTPSLMLVDASSNARHGHYTSVTLGAAGATTDGDLAATFNGTTSRARVAHGSWMNSAQFTLEAWVKTSSSGSYRAILDRDLGGGVGRSWQFRMNPSGRVEFVKIAGGVQTVTSTSAVNTGAWRHVAFTRDSTTARMYVDGVEEVSVAMAAMPGTLELLAFGVNGSGGLNAFWNGQMDEAAFYGDALSAARIAAHVAAR